MKVAKSIALCSATFVVFGLVTTASAQDRSEADTPSMAGKYETTLSGSGGSDNDFDTNTLGLSGSVGYYTTDSWLWGIRQGVNFADPNGGDNSLSGRTLGFGQYVFGAEKLRPFIGINFGGIYGDNVADTFAAGPEAGLKYYADRNTFVFGLVEYQVVFDEVSSFDNTFDDGNFGYTVGVGFNF